MMMMMMTELFLLTILITAKISGSQNVIMVDHVPVQQGKSIIIPCTYKAKYLNYSKYLCFGFKYFCTDVKTIKGRTVFISDDQTQLIFTVTMKNLTTSDAGYYWCSVKSFGTDAQERFQLKVTKATPELYVENQLLTGYEGSHLMISCYHQNKKPTSWCKIGGPCVGTTGYISGASVQLSSTDWGFRVTMSNLTMNNTGWYWCSAGDQQIPVHITVQRSTPSWERKSLAWLVFLGFLLVVAGIVLMLFRQHIPKCEMFSSRKRSENAYVSMKKPKQQTKQHEDEEAQEYEIMSRPKQTPLTQNVQGTVRAMNHQRQMEFTLQTKDITAPAECDLHYSREENMESRVNKLRTFPPKQK